MSELGPDGTPDIGRQFDQAQREPEPTWHLEHDAAEWEPIEEQHSEKHLTLEHTPGGSLEYDVHVDIEKAKADVRQAERAVRFSELADEQELNFSDDFNAARRDDLKNDFRREAEQSVEWESLIDERFKAKDREAEHDWER